MWKGRDGMLMTVVSNIWDGKNHGVDDTFSDENKCPHSTNTNEIRD